MGETTAVAHGGNPQDRAASPRPRCIASIFPTPHPPHPIPCLVFSLVVTPSGRESGVGSRESGVGRAVSFFGINCQVNGHETELGCWG
ncbi:MAG: hypothetical protein F6J90_08040 [Moorea sp. SIOASIH]|uniref:hypothetical protein n=1 Tax=Moorena sp. SIOASIH TaxID=2607817 RepID=UPI0013BC1936|nr:hypothetical protein [Moorena sp. SIOASIH]NEO36271.1 hypothetical protein [Moorena sp. SIOASIH]